MVDWIQSHALALLIFCGASWLFVRVMRDPDNTLDWCQFISSKGEDGKQYADLDKLGKIVGIGIGSWAVIITVKEGHVDAAILTVYLAFVGAINGWSAYLRSKQ